MWLVNDALVPKFFRLGPAGSEVVQSETSEITGTIVSNTSTNCVITENIDRMNSKSDDH
jgi:hypothetical protein